GIAGDFDGASGSAIGACYSAAEVLSETPGSFNGYAGGIAGTLGTNGAIEDCLALNFPSITVNSPLSPTASRVVGDNNGTLSGNRARAGMELIPNRDPGIPSWTDTTHPLGADITLSDPPEAANFDNTELDTDEAWSVFAMPPEGWDYPYPVFPWQILEGIQP
ncbi:MAG: hypothetical protein LBH26_08160, partial [Treponema sp.]|nr:hypothetical protein [Treponema sp.]